MARALKTRAVKSGSREKTKKLLKKPTLKRVSAAAIVQKELPKKAGPLSSTTGGEKKNVSQMLLETIERRKREKAQKQGLPEKRPGRRGRKPKNVDYTPSNNEEDQYVYEAEYERLEYDTGIRLKDHNEEAGNGLERIEEFDEELNFDW